MSALELDCSEEAARRAMKIIWGDVPEGELVEISARKKSKWRSVFSSVEEALGGGPDGIWAARKASAEKMDVYYGVVSLREQPPRGRRGSSGLRASAAVAWLDIDVTSPGREGPAYFGSVDEAVRGVGEVLDELIPGLSRGVLWIGSGWGVQAVIPLSERVSAGEASGLVRRLVSEVGDRTGRKIDRIWDSSRVLRMPATWNWRAGPGLEQASGVLRWPLAGAVSAAELGAALPEEEARPAARISGRGPGGAGGALLDVAALTNRLCTWQDVLVPGGWRLASSGAGREAQVWTRPGAEAGERSAVVFADKPELLVVFSDSGECGFGKGLMRGVMGDAAAGAGVVDKWTAHVWLTFGGDWARAREVAWDGGGLLGGELAAEWDVAREVVGEWVELADRSVWGPGQVGAREELNRRAAAAVGAGLGENAA